MNFDKIKKSLKYVEYIADKKCGKRPQVLLINLARASKKSKFIKDNFADVMTMHGVISLRDEIINDGHDLAKLCNTPDGQGGDGPKYPLYRPNSVLKELHTIFYKFPDQTAYVAYGLNHSSIYQVSWDKAFTIWKTIYDEIIFQQKRANNKRKKIVKASKQDN